VTATNCTIATLPRRHSCRCKHRDRSIIVVIIWHGHHASLRLTTETHHCPTTNPLLKSPDAILCNRARHVEIISRFLGVGFQPQNVHCQVPSTTDFTTTNSQNHVCGARLYNTSRDHEMRVGDPPSPGRRRVVFQAWEGLDFGMERSRQDLGDRFEFDQRETSAVQNKCALYDATCLHVLLHGGHAAKTDACRKDSHKQEFELTLVGIGRQLRFIADDRARRLSMAPRRRCPSSSLLWWSSSFVVIVSVARRPIHGGVQGRDGTCAHTYTSQNQTQRQTRCQTE
jgi:hypothetical protein